MYRRSFSELPSSQNLNTPNINRRSLGSDILQTTFPKSSSSMTDIQSSQHSIGDLNGRLTSFNRSTNNISAAESSASHTLYTYIGISEPDRDKGHLYENQSIVNAHSKNKHELEPKRHEQV